MRWHPRKWLGPLLFLLTVGVLSAGAQTTNTVHEFTLQSAVRLALEQNRDLARLAAAHQSALLDRELAAQDFAVRARPNSGVSSTEGVQYRQLGVDLLKKTAWGTELELGGSVSDTEPPDGDPTMRKSAHITLSQPLFRYAGRMVNLEPMERASSRIKTALRSVELKKSDVALQVVQTYLDIHRAEQQAEIERTALQRLEKLQRLTKVRAQQGRASRVDALRVESQLGDAESRVRSVAERVATLRLDLADLVGLEPRIELRLTAPPLTPGDPPPPVELAVATACSNRLDLAQVEQDYGDVVRGLRIARHALQPDLRLVTTVESHGTGSTLDRADLFDKLDWSIALQADGDLGAGRERIAFRQARLSEGTALDDIETTRRLVERQVRQAWLSLSRAQAEVELARRNRVVAENRLRIAQRAFEVGRGDNFSVTDAETQFQQTEDAWLTAQTEAVLADYRLRRVTGTLIDCPADLKPGARAEGGSDGGTGKPGK